MKLEIITGRHMERVVRGYTDGETPRPKRALHGFPAGWIKTLCFRGFTDGEYEVLDNCDAPAKRRLEYYIVKFVPVLY